MNPALLYLVKVVLCSGVLFGYYSLALRNKIFHQWNRFYLLACVVLSLLAPLLTFHIDPSNTPARQQVISLLHVVSLDGDAEVESRTVKTVLLTTEQWLWLGYCIMALVVTVAILASAIRIYRILHAYPKTTI